ncbi:hypothetical protein Tco_0386108 [Tanacetum coccineum]
MRMKMEVQEQSTSEDILACGVLPVQDFIKCVQHIPKRIVVIYILNFLLVFFQPPKIKSFIDGVVATPLEKIQEPQKIFVWEFEKGDFHHWLDLFNHFDTYFKKYIQPRKDLQLEDDFLEHDHAFPRVDVFHILHVVQIILENYTNKHFYSSYEYHLSSLLASTDVDWLKPVYMMSDSSFSLVRTYESPSDSTSNSSACIASMAQEFDAWFKEAPIDGRWLFRSDIILLVDKEVADGVNVMSISLGGGITTVGVSTMDRDFPSYVKLGSGATMKGVSLYKGRRNLLPNMMYHMVYTGSNSSTPDPGSLCLEGT